MTLMSASTLILSRDLFYTDGLGMDDAPLHIVWSDVIDFMEAFTPNAEFSGAT